MALNCPKHLWFYTESGLPKQTDYPRVMGDGVHRFIKELYRHNDPDRTFRFKTKESAFKAWFGVYFPRLLAEERHRILVPDKKRERQGFWGGWICISNYWDTNINSPKPNQMEVPYSEPYSPGWILTGRADQVRSVSLEWIELHRPELIVNGRLADGYMPIVLADLKTDRRNYTRMRFKNDPTLMDEIRYQYQLHEGLQPTMYTYLFWKKWGVLPVGFMWLHLRSGKPIFTFRDRDHFDDLFEVIEYYIGNVEAEAFPKNPGKHCEYCDYFAPCRGGKKFLVTRSGTLPERTDTIQVSSRSNAMVGEQIKMELFRPRTRKAPKKKGGLKTGTKIEIEKMATIIDTMQKLDNKT